eukprot:6380831-Alexandrium_andersonii.AAC.1
MMPFRQPWVRVRWAPAQPLTAAAPALAAWRGGWAPMLGAAPPSLLEAGALGAGSARRCASRHSY